MITRGRNVVLILLATAAFTGNVVAASPQGVARTETTGRTGMRRLKPKAQKPLDSRKRGDLRRVQWTRPFSAAHKIARSTNRVLLVKPLMGGSNTPDPAGVPCGGVNDCEGSW